MTILGRKPTWPGCGVHSARELARKARRLGRHNIRVGQVARPLWRLSSGAFVTDDVARTVIDMPCVVSVGDTLAGELSQTFRFAEGEGNG